MSIYNNLNPDAKQRMMDYLPTYYASAPEVEAIIGAEAAEMKTVEAEVQDLLNQFFVSTATWALSRWEALCGIETDEAAPIAERRSAVMVRLRGQGTSTVVHIKNVAEAYLNGEVDVEERNSAYEVVITFVGKKGVPTNLSAIEQAITDIIPAHLQPLFVVTWLSWDEVEARGVTWDAIDAMTWDAFEMWNQ